MNELKIFENEEFGQIRAIEKDGEPWFVGKDVAEALGYGDGNVKSKALTNAVNDHVDDEDKTLLSYNEFKGYQNGDLKNISHYGAYVINESGLYSLILSSKLPTAKKFKRWVTSEVLPSIRKHGMYAMPDTVEKMIADPDTAIRLLTTLKEEQNKRKVLEDENAQQKQLIAEFNPKASYYDVVLQTADVLSSTQIAKDYGKSAKWLNKLLHELGVQFKQGKTWLLYQKYAEQGYTKSKTDVYSGKDGKQHSRIHTYWTQKGRLFIYDLLKSQGILPFVEAKGA